MGGCRECVPGKDDVCTAEEQDKDDVVGHKAHPVEEKLQAHEHDVCVVHDQRRPPEHVVHADAA